MKERVFEDENGYTVVEEHSEYEEMTPEEIAKQKAPAPKALKQAVLPTTKKPEIVVGGTGKMKQGGLMGFFGKK